MSAKTIYFGDHKLWERLREAADEHNVSVSSMIHDAVEAYLSDASLGCPTCARVREILKVK